MASSDMIDRPSSSYLLVEQQQQQPGSPPAALPTGPEAQLGAGSRRLEPAARLPGLDRARGRRRRRR
ncbi:Hypothetical predicted protein [Marmota monax]|uniref:Uncharacterized protein n=1 Tax=Marmota monax TaxID=9995 RepID=A0A5E4AR63_MARMO|nr:hypothetical protein GHT09_013291 [Marmota monax]VTJ59794.1 Hypothetical predicted protein [Marmota monax]